jgi:hypothetical protein
MDTSTAPSFVAIATTDIAQAAAAYQQRLGRPPVRIAAHRADAPALAAQLAAGLYQLAPLPHGGPQPGELWLEV